MSRSVRSGSRLLVLSLLAVVVCWAGSAQAVQYWWDADGATTTALGGTGNWNDSSSLWRSGSATGTLQAWTNSYPNSDEAIFAGSAGTVSLTTGINANSLTFNSTGYVVQSNTLTLSGTTPSVTTSTGVSTTISSVIAGSAGLTKAGLGTLTLTGANSYTGGTTINGGLLVISADGTGATNPLGAYPSVATASNIALNGSAKLATLATGLGNSGTTITLGANRGIVLGTGLQTFVAGYRQSLTINGIISGSGGVIVSENDGYNNGGTGGGANTSFGGSNTYTGDTIILDLGSQDRPFNPAQMAFKTVRSTTTPP